MCLSSALVNANTNKNTTMYYLLVKFTVKLESTKDFKKACLESIKESRKESGNVEMKLYIDTNKPNVFFVYSRWKNEAAYATHQTLAHSINIAKVAKESLLEEPQIMELGQTNPAINHDLKQVNVEDKEETIFFIFKVKEGYRERIIERFATHIKHTVTEEGNLFFDFYTIGGNENTFVVYENWRNKSELWDIHMKKPYSEVTGKLIQKALVSEMEQYMNFVTEVN